MITRTQRETVMLEALEDVRNDNRHGDLCPALWAVRRDCDCHMVEVARALAAVKAMDDAEMAARGTVSAGGEVLGG